MSIHSVHYQFLPEFLSLYLSSLKCFTKEDGCLINPQISLFVNPQQRPRHSPKLGDGGSVCAARWMQS